MKASQIKGSDLIQFFKEELSNYPSNEFTLQLNENYWEIDKCQIDLEEIYDTYIFGDFLHISGRKEKNVSIEKAIKLWRKKQTHTTLVLSVPKDILPAIKTVLKKFPLVKI